MMQWALYASVSPPLRAHFVGREGRFSGVFAQHMVVFLCGHKGWYARIMGHGSIIKNEGLHRKKCHLVSPPSHLIRHHGFFTII